MSLSEQTVTSLKSQISLENSQEGPVFPSSSRDPLFNQPDELLTQSSLLDTLGRKKNTCSQNKEPWKNNPRYFDSIMVSRLACLKMLKHAMRGGNIEVMGMLVGTTVNNQIIVFDCYELPVEGTETRVNAQSESYEYMVQYMNEMVSDSQAIVGWYHSHPGYDCWLSTIDMRTQELNQNYQDPYVGIVVDPYKSLESGRLAIGAFRTVHNNSINGEDDDTESLQFYELNMSIFESEFDKSLDSSSLKFEMPKANLNNDLPLVNSLLEIMRQWYNSSQLQRKSLPRKEPLSVSNLSQKTEEESEIEQQSRQLDIYRRQTRSNSLASITTSTEDDSDVDMNEHHPEDTESLSSSVHTMTESATPLRRSTQPPLNMLRRPWLHGMELAFQPQSSDVIEQISGPETLQNDALLIDYDATKKALIELKMREYRRLRYCRDCFTI